MAVQDLITALSQCLPFEGPIEAFFFFFDTGMGRTVDYKLGLYLSVIGIGPNWQ